MVGPTTTLTPRSGLARLTRVNALLLVSVAAAVAAAGGSSHGDSSIAFDSRGRIVIVGNTGRDVMLVVLDAAGVDDASFVGTGVGRQRVVTGTGSLSDGAQALALQPDGRIVTAGWAPDGGGIRRVGVVRIPANGEIDRSFGGGVQRLSYPAAASFAEGAVLKPDGNLLIAGDADVGINSGVRRLT